jgi:phage tail sheath protein FI
VRAGLETLVEALSRDPELARLLFVEARGLDSPRYRPYRRTMDTFADLLEAAGEGELFNPKPPASTARAVVSGVIATIAREVDGGRVAGLPRLAPELLFLVLVPYEGSEVAEAEMRRWREE